MVQGAGLLVSHGGDRGACWSQLKNLLRGRVRCSNERVEDMQTLCVCMQLHSFATMQTLAMRGTVGTKVWVQLTSKNVNQAWYTDMPEAGCRWRSPVLCESTTEVT